jgi:hypothetical protein
MGISALLVLLLVVPIAQAQKSSTWSFAVSGDSRNCGDVIMPAIAAAVKRDKAEFYWHLGDFRAIFAMDEDIRDRATGDRPSSTEAYQKIAWQDAIENQLAAFVGMDVFVGIGNHETIPPKSRGEFITAFDRWLDQPIVHDQRHSDDPKDGTVKSYFHWKKNGVDFIYLDNASQDEFDQGQVTWFEKVLAADKPDVSVKTVVVGMHAALPNSLAAGHSMNNWKRGDSSGTQVYTDLVDFRNQSKKMVYVLASHSHFYMNGIFDTEWWKSHGGVLPGWIVGTAGAHRYRLPEDAGKAKEAKTNVYGYLLGTAHDDGTIDFQFKELKESDISTEARTRFGASLVHFCFSANSDEHH